MRHINPLIKLVLGATALLLVFPAASERELLSEKSGNVVRPDRAKPTSELIEGLKPPDGFKVSVFADELGEPRMMTLGTDGTVYVTRRKPGDVLAIRDVDGDGKAEERTTVVQGLEGVHGIALHEGVMYLCTVRSLYSVAMKDGAMGEPRNLIDDLPEGGRHPNRTIDFGPDGMLYISIGSTCNCCMEDSPESAAILRAKPDGSERKIFASGLRNTIGFGWHPETGEMWGMDHGSDWLGDDFPPEELNKLLEGRNYGWPLVHGNRKIIPAEEPPKGIDLEEFAKRSEPPILEYTAHSAPIQMVFYTGSQFPDEYRNDAFVAMRGSWNRQPPSGYEVVRIRFKDGRPTEASSFLSGFLLPGPEYLARPAGIAVASDGSLLVGDDSNGVIYRVAYHGYSKGGGL